MAITEGKKFTVSNISFSGETFGREAELKALMQLKSGDVFNGTRLSESMKAIGERLGNYGYAFANANAAPDINRDTSQVAFTVVVDPGRRAYVRRINIVGNERTRDEVIRRELRQLEGAYFDGEKVRRSRDRVDRLGYFEEVKVDTPAVPGAADLVDVNLAVKERPTGNLSFGAGFSSSEKLVLTAGISQSNIFGTGNTFGFDINTSKSNSVISLSQTNPYFTIDGVSQGFDIYSRNYKPESLDLGDYSIKSNGAGLRFGIPLTDLSRFTAGTAIENTDITLTENSPERYVEYVADNGNSSTAMTVSLGWSRDDRDSGVLPTRGTLQRATFEVTLPVFDLRYYRMGYQHQKYFPLSSNYTLMLNGQVDWGDGIGGKSHPLFKNYSAGGIGSVRGYESGSLSQDRDAVDDVPLGGTSRVIGNAELLFPLPGVSNKTLRLYVFTDAGNTFPENTSPDLGNLKWASGVGLSWLSPVGPLRLSWAKPWNTEPQDRVQTVQFQLGTSF